MTTTEPTFQDAVDLLLDENQPLSQTIISLFSDITPTQLNVLQEAWENISLSRRQYFLGNLQRELETNTLLCFDVLARSLIDDADPIIRASAIRLLGECEREDLIPAFLKIAQKDAETEPRAEAITTLSTFVLRGELEEISVERFKEIEEVLLAIAKDSNEKTELRQRALESLGYSSHRAVAALIREAWLRDTPMWKACAVLAMGRSCDEGWRDEVLDALLHENDLVRLAAAKAAGELALPTARPIMLKMLEEEEDEAVLRALIWSLSQIGGEDVREYLLSLLDQYDDE